MSIATKRGDGGQTGLIGGARVSKSDPRVECYGTIDELISQLGFARSICSDQEVCEGLKQIQRELFKVSSAVARAQEDERAAPEVTQEMVDHLESEVHRIEAMPGIVADWSLPGELPDASAIDVARTVCRRTERLATRVLEVGQLGNVLVLAYLNRLSDLLWLLGRLLEVRAGVDSSMRPTGQPVRGWTRAW
jgi:cob(I)alamin adenosyltransferase